MYSFSKGRDRLFVKGSREVDDNDNITDPGDRHITSHFSARDHGITSAELSHSSRFESKSSLASASQESQELLRSNNVRSGLKTVQTHKVVRKTTTIALGEKKESTHVKVRERKEFERKNVRTTCQEDVVQNQSITVLQSDGRLVSPSLLYSNPSISKRRADTHYSCDSLLTPHDSTSLLTAESLCRDSSLTLVLQTVDVVISCLNESV